MNSYMRLKPLQFALLLAFASAPASVWAAGPYPPLPPSLSTSVAPNIIFYLDTSGSMLQNDSNQWIRTDLCNPNPRPPRLRPTDPTYYLYRNWDTCINDDYRGFRVAVDSDPRTKMNIAKEAVVSALDKLIYVKDPVTGNVERDPVTRNVVVDPVTGAGTRKGETVRVGLFSFHDVRERTDNSGRDKGSILRAPVTDVSVLSNETAFNTALNNLNGRTATPLGEGLFEITRYLQGATSWYEKPTNPMSPTVLGRNYTSPIQYRCQKNVAIVITDGDAKNDDTLPGAIINNRTTSGLEYTARDSSGTAVTKTFNVCNASDGSASNATNDNDLDVNCPATLEGTNTRRDFTDETNVIVNNPTASITDRKNLPSALRDVAKYGRVADLRVGGQDLDGKSFDDERFAKQNLTTYTVAFAIGGSGAQENPVLQAAAQVGGGRYFLANTGKDLETALNEAVNSIGAFTSNAGGLATQSEISGGGNKLFQPVFNPSGWRGELRCFQLDANSNVTGVCTPNAIANIPAPTGRTLITSRRDAGTADATLMFNFADTLNPDGTRLLNYSDDQVNSLGANLTEQRQTINYVRGVDTSGVTRSRTVLLGDIIDGQPLVVSKPFGATVDANYRTFTEANTSRNIVLIGANDGMLHAFRVSDMSEIMGYIPSSVYPNLKALKSPSYGTAAEPHRYHVNGSLRQADVGFGPPGDRTWTTLVVGGLGQGGQGYFALDAKNEDQLKSPQHAVKWEFTDRQHSGMGYSFGAPIIYNVRVPTPLSESLSTPGKKTAIPAVIVSNGYDSDFNDTASGGTRTTTKASALYIINAETGALIRAIDTNIRPNPDNEIRATPASWGGGLSSPAGLDEENDGVLDYVYAGDMNGRMWRFNLKNDDPEKFFVEPIPIFDAGSQRPITSRPAVMPVFKTSGEKVGNMVLFGTGKFLTDADRSSTTTQYLYGILDKMQAPLLRTVPNTVSDESLQEQTIDGLYTNTDPDAGPLRSYRHMSNKPIDLRSGDTNGFKGWRIPLPTSGERNVAAPNVFADKVFFATGTPISAEKCSPGSGWVMGLNPLTGSSVRAKNASTGAEYSFIDMDKDERPTTGDQRPFTPEPSVAGATTKPGYVSGFSVPAVPTELSFFFDKLSVLPATASSAFGDDGSSVALRESNTQAVYSGVLKLGGPATNPNPEKECHGEGGNDNMTCTTTLTAPENTKVFSTIWREIKN
jgi:type IV pilus assembly protein PilY1